MPGQQPNPQPFRCPDMPWIIMRMVALGYHPYTISACTGVPVGTVHETIKTFYASGYGLPASQPIAPQSLWPPPPSGHYGLPPSQAVAPPPPARGRPPLQGYSRQNPTYYSSYPPSQAPNTPIRGGAIRLSLAGMTPIKRPSSGDFNYEFVSGDHVSGVSHVPHSATPEPSVVGDSLPSVTSTGSVGEQSITESDIKTLRDYVELCPSTSVDDLLGVLRQRRISVSFFKLIQTLHENDIPIPKVERLDEQSEHIREEYEISVGKFEPEQLVFIGQVACDVRYGWSYLGRTRRAKSQKFVVCFALSSEGMVGLRIWTDVGDENVYETFVEYALQWMQPVPGSKSVAVLDRRGVSEESQVLKDIETCGRKHIFVPPGSAEYNPTKQAVTLIKSNIAHAQKMFGDAETKEDAETILHHEVFNVQKEQAKEWFRQCGYYA